MPRRNANAIRRVPSVETAKEARSRQKELEAYYASYEAELDNLLDEVESRFETQRAAIAW